MYYAHISLGYRLLSNILSLISKIWGKYVQELLRVGFQRPKQGVDVGDHPPITPVRSVVPGLLTGDMARLYEMITRYFLATVSPDARCEVKCVLISLSSWSKSWRGFCLFCACSVFDWIASRV